MKCLMMSWHVSWCHVLSLVLFHADNFCLMMTIIVLWWQFMSYDVMSCFSMTIHAPWWQFMSYDVIMSFPLSLDCPLCPWTPVSVPGPMSRIGFIPCYVPWHYIWSHDWAPIYVNDDIWQVPPLYWQYSY